MGLVSFDFEMSLILTVSILCWIKVEK
jgi:hypothetical protein